MKVWRWIICVIPLLCISLWVFSQLRSIQYELNWKDGGFEIYSEPAYLCLGGRSRGIDFQGFSKYRKIDRINRAQATDLGDSFKASIYFKATGGSYPGVSVVLPWWFLTATCVLIVLMFTMWQRKLVIRLAIGVVFLSVLISAWYLRGPVWIRIEGTTEVADPRPQANGKLLYPEITDPIILESLHGKTNWAQICEHLEHSVLSSVYGGNIHLEYRPDLDQKIWVVSQFRSSRYLTDRDVKLLVNETREHWSVGSGQKFDSDIEVSPQIRIRLDSADQKVRVLRLANPGFEPQ